MASHRDVQAYLETAPRCQAGNCEVLNGKGKRSCRKDQVRIEKMNENEPLMKCRENNRSVKTIVLRLTKEECSGNLFTGCVADVI